MYIRRIQWKIRRLYIWLTYEHVTVCEFNRTWLSFGKPARHFFRPRIIPGDTVETDYPLPPHRFLIVNPRWWR